MRYLFFSYIKILSGRELEETDVLSFLVDEVAEKDRHQWLHQYA